MQIVEIRVTGTANAIYVDNGNAVNVRVFITADYHHTDLVCE